MIPTLFQPLGQNRNIPYLALTVKPTAANLTYGFVPWSSAGWCFVDWGDGSQEQVTPRGTAVTHTYSAAGTYSVKIQGNLYSIRFNLDNYCNLLYNCNMNFSAVGTLSQTFEMFEKCNNLVISKGVVIPDSVINIGRMFRISTVHVRIARVPSSVTGIQYFCQGSANVYCNLDTAFAEVVQITSPIEYCFLRASNVTGSVALFMRKIKTAMSIQSAFLYSGCTPFGADDYFEIVLTATARQSWGFTPVSSAATWYVVDWGDGTAVSDNKNLNVFTDGTRISHTFANAGTYHIKLAMNASEVTFDRYDSDNGKWAMLGNPTH